MVPRRTPPTSPASPGDYPGSNDTTSLEDAALGRALRGSRGRGRRRRTHAGDRPGPLTVYRYLAQFAEQGRAEQVGWAAGARPTRAVMTMSNCLSQLSLSLPRACLHVKRGDRARDKYRDNHDQ